MERTVFPSGEGPTAYRSNLCDLFGGFPILKTPPMNLAISVTRSSGSSAHLGFSEIILVVARRTSAVAAKPSWIMNLPKT
jgi:hypothetical protein